MQEYTHVYLSTRIVTFYMVARDLNSGPHILFTHTSQSHIPRPHTDFF